MAKVDPESTGLNPAWRKAISMIYVGESIADEDGSLNFNVIQERRARLVEGTKLIDELSVDSGAYLNEVSCSY